jgi:gluconate 2-dehydrogenase subunit 3-like protein
MAEIERRAFVKGATLGALAFTVGGSTVMLTARQARAGNVPFRLLKEGEAETIESMGETLVPGARSAGIAHFIDQQIAAPPEQALLQLRILNAKPPFANFYRAAVRAIDGSSDKTFGRKFAMLSPGDKRDFVNLMRQNKAAGWQGPAGPFVYNVLRSDAVDVVYSTMDGYEALGVPYMAHIAPERRW